MTAPQTILITGATSGIGRQTALLLARDGHRVFATGRNVEALADLASEGLPNLETVALDVTDRDSLAAAVRIVDEATQGEGVDVLINNAGFGVIAPMIEVTEADLRRQFETNVFGLVAVTQAFAKRMRQRGAGRIINVSSMGGRMTLPFLGSYNATKYALESLSDGLRNELRPLGIRVVLVEPGIINTRFNDTAVRGLGRYASDASPYADALIQLQRTMHRAERFGADPIVVAKAIRKVALSRRPPARVVTPWHGAVMLWLLAVLPTSWTDALIRRMGGLTPSAMRPGKPEDADLTRMAAE